MLIPKFFQTKDSRLLRTYIVIKRESLINWQNPLFVMVGTDTDYSGEKSRLAIPF